MKCSWEGCDCEATIVVCRAHYGELTQKRLHGVAEYRRGCRCPTCVRAESARGRTYHAKNKERINRQRRERRLAKKEGQQ